jgi:hypothetical protein
LNEETRIIGIKLLAVNIKLFDSQLIVLCPFFNPSPDTSYTGAQAWEQAECLNWTSFRSRHPLYFLPLDGKGPGRGWSNPPKPVTMSLLLMPQHPKI